MTEIKRIIYILKLNGIKIKSNKNKLVPIMTNVDPIMFTNFFKNFEDSFLVLYIKNPQISRGTRTYGIMVNI